MLRSARAESRAGQSRRLVRCPSLLLGYILVVFSSFLALDGSVARGQVVIRQVYGGNGNVLRPDDTITIQTFSSTVNRSQWLIAGYFRWRTINLIGAPVKSNVARS